MPQLMRLLLATVLLLTSSCSTVLARRRAPLVREVRSYREFQALIEHHKTKTGLGVIVDFYSDSCGPCRQIAPLYKNLAKDYKGKVVFAKVNVQTAHEVSSRVGIRSMPTFHFYHLGKKKQEFSGADTYRLQNFASSLSSAGAKYQVMLTKDALMDFYAEHDPTKTEEDIAALLAKHEPRIAHYKLAKKLERKYGSAPKTVHYKKAKKAPAPAPAPSSRKSRRPGPAPEPAKPNLHLASLKELQAEVLRRLEEDEDEDDDNGDDERDDDDDDLDLTLYEDDSFPERVVILGGGPAGLAAAIYTARAGLEPVIIAPPLGGQLQGKGVTVENYPGVTGGTGPSIVNMMLKQAHDVGALFLQEHAVAVDLGRRPFVINTEHNETVHSHSLIVATGATSRWLGVPGENIYRGGGVSTCATCDGFLFRDQHVVVIGGGDTAMEDALVLARTSSKVTLVHRRDTFRASKILAERVKFNEKIEIVWNTTIESFEGESTQDADTGKEVARLTHVMLRGNGALEPVRLDAKGAFVAIGHDPATYLFKGQVELDEHNYIVTKGRSTQTSVEGVFAAGDVMDHVYRQAITSAGSGSAAALDAERWLSAQGIQDERETCLDDIMSEVLSEMEGKY